MWVLNLWNWINHWREPPDFPGDEEKTTQARLLDRVGSYFVLALITGAAVLILFFTEQRAASIALVLALLIFYSIGRYFVFRGELVFASVFFISSTWVIFEIVAIISGGIASPMNFGILAATFVIGLILKPRLGNTLVAVSVLAALGLAVIQQRGVVLEKFFDIPPLATWFLFALSVIFITGFMNLVVRNLQNALDLARQESEARRLAEQALRQSDNRWRSLLQNVSAVSIQGYRPDGTTLYWNQASERLYGYPAQEAIGRNLLDLIIPPEMRADVKLAMRQMIETGQPIPASEMALMRSDGSRVAVFSSHAIVQIPGNDPELFCFDIDLTQRKQAEEALRESETRYRLLAENSSDVIWTMDPSTRFTYISPAIQQLRGYTSEEAMQESYEQTMPPRSQVLVAEIFRKRNEEGNSGRFDSIQRFEIEQYHKDGSLVWVEITTRYLLNDQGKPIGLLGVSRDITEHKQRERELKAIVTLSAALRRASNRAQMVPLMLEQIVSLLNIESVTVEIIDPETGEAVVEAGYGPWKLLVGTRQKSGTGINAIISQTLQLYHTHDLEHDPNLTYHDWARENIRGCAGIPLVAQEQLIGFIWIGRRTDITDAEVRLLAAIADIAANAIYRATLHEQTQRDAFELARAYDATLEGLARTLELRDRETEGHSQRVKEMTLRLACAVGLDEAELVQIRRGAILHDIGKIGIPDRILQKPGALTDKEWVTMRMHPQYAFDLLSTIEHLRPAIEIPYCHHEKWDGSGYPRGLQGEQIPLAARLFAVVDVWDALRSDRVYRKQWPENKVLSHIQAKAGTHFDPRVVELFLKVVAQDG